MPVGRRGDWGDVGENDVLEAEKVKVCPDGAASDAELDSTNVAEVEEGVIGVGIIGGGITNVCGSNGSGGDELRCKERRKEERVAVVVAAVKGGEYNAKLFTTEKTQRGKKIQRQEERQVVRISGNVGADIACFQRAAEAAIAAGMPATWEIPAAVEVPVVSEIPTAVEVPVASEIPVAVEHCSCFCLVLVFRE
ncbi:hypothetical protein U1Q18_027390 [Sarracenia purpurea var. burkii]